ncbi:MAG: adenosylcobinamide-GDP ribazoletransferase, partial [Burkholderiaceae bacterium]
WMVAALVCSAAFSRGCVALVLGSLPYARDETDAKAKPIAGRVSAGDVLCAVLFAVAPSIALATWTGDATPVLMATSFALGAAALMRRMIRRRLGGYTGDCLGAVQQVAELAFLLGLLIVLGALPDVLPTEDPEEEE